MWSGVLWVFFKTLLHFFFISTYTKLKGVCCEKGKIKKRWVMYLPIKCMFLPCGGPKPGLGPSRGIWAVTLDFQQCGMCDQQRLRPACTFAQSDQSLKGPLLVRILSYWLNIIWLFLRLKGGCTGWSESTHVKMKPCWTAHFWIFFFFTSSPLLITI